MFLVSYLYGKIEKDTILKNKDMIEDVFYNQLCLEEERLTQRLTIINKLKGLYDGSPPTNPSSNKASNTNKQQSVRKKKGIGPTVPNKVLAALKQITEGKVVDVAKVLMEKIDASYTPKKAKKDCAHHLSIFYRKGVINATGDRRTGYTYSIKKAGS